MVWNVWMTIRGKVRVEKPMSDAAYDPAKDRPLPARPAPARASYEPLAIAAE
jgi:cytochrome c oxidase cbb3-type subunit 1